MTKEQATALKQLIDTFGVYLNTPMAESEAYPGALPPMARSRFFGLASQTIRCSWPMASTALRCSGHINTY